MKAWNARNHCSIAHHTAITNSVVHCILSHNTEPSLYGLLPVARILGSDLLCNLCINIHHAALDERINVDEPPPPYHCHAIVHIIFTRSTIVDCTITVNDSLDLLAEFMGHKEEVEALTNQASGCLPVPNAVCCFGF
jgi:hypothetical protein